MSNLDTLVSEFRARNGDVFTDGGALRNAMFTVEEITEAVNVFEDLIGGSYLRSERRSEEKQAERDYLRGKLKIEIGQAIFMLISTAHSMGIHDIDEALAAALDKLEARCQAARKDDA